MRPPGRWARASPTPSAWPSPRSGSPHEFNRPGHEIVDHWIYGICSDGDLQEGHLGRGGQPGRPPSSRAAGLPVRRQPRPARRADVVGLGRGRARALRRVQVAHPARHGRQRHGCHRKRDRGGARGSAAVASSPCARVIGYGSPNKAGTQKAHGAALGEEEVRLTKQFYGWDPDKTFYVPPEAEELFRQAVPRGEGLYKEWQDRLDRYEAEFPDEAAELRRRMDGKLARRLGRRPALLGRRMPSRWPPATPRRRPSRRWRRRCPSCSAVPPTCPRAT